jgi:hypothetical protein
MHQAILIVEQIREQNYQTAALQTIRDIREYLTDVRGILSRLL